MAARKTGSYTEARLKIWKSGSLPGNQAPISEIKLLTFKSGSYMADRLLSRSLTGSYIIHGVEDPVDLGVEACPHTEIPQVVDVDKREHLCPVAGDVRRPVLLRGDEEEPDHVTPSERPSAP